MSIPNNDTDPLSAASQKREGDLHLRAQHEMATDQMQNMDIFAFLFALFTGMKPETGVGSEQAIKQFANVFHIDTASFQKTVNSYHSGDISAHEAARQTYKQTEPSSVDMAKAEQVVAKYANSDNPMLELITSKESGRDYNRLCGAGHQRADLTSMSIDKVLEFQRDRINNGGQSASGKYQIIRETLIGLKKNMGLSGKELFDPEMQDRMAEHLLNEKGYQEFLAGKISPEQMMLNASKIWAAAPKDMGGESYYKGVGNNKAHIAPEAMLLALHKTRDIHIAKQNGLSNQYNENVAQGGTPDDAKPSQPIVLTDKHRETMESEGTDEVKVAAAKEAEQPQPEDPAVASTTEPTVGMTA